MPAAAAHTHDAHGRDTHGPTAHDHARMLAKWAWRDFLNITLGIWLLSAPFTLGYYRTSPRLAWNDALCGLAVVVIAAFTLFPRFDLARWGLCAIGLWLLFAPLVFWTPDAGAYNNDTLVGALIIAFSVLIPMMPSRTHHRVMTAPGPETPPGWSYNPSDWAQRGPIIAMALVGFFLSRFLAAYQLGHTPVAWDPVFKDGTRRVLESKVSKAFPISDAGLGAASYMIEALSGFMGGTNRWRTMPWMVLMFGVLVVPLGVVSIVLVILQPVAVGAWCFLCLVTACAMLIMIAPALDEVIATIQFLRQARRQRLPFWRTFWVGGSLPHPPEGVEQHAPGSSPQKSIAARVIAAFDLNNIPWNLPIPALVGVWLMAAPAVLDSSGYAAKSDQLTGALIVTFSVIAFGEIARPARFLNIPLALWLALAPWVLSGDTAASRWNDLAAALVVIAFSIRRGPITQHFGPWNRRLV